MYSITFNFIPVHLILHSNTKSNSKNSQNNRAKQSSSQRDLYYSYYETTIQCNNAKIITLLLH
ncbi:Orf133 [Heliothis zea nudivirus]|uniref:Orf133 n=1 Tax=Heliothis zea nudivirus 1 TaxID=3116536 RepID=Q8JKI0_9VIRU|nr:Orf133 [Heliothis zea nudivirus]AAN04425.1 Orf133 [Heliothis zea nudivirus]WCZ68497.1 hypothetical protein HvNV017 [Heliothis virescens nudivirus]